MLTLASCDQGTVHADLRGESSGLSACFPFFKSKPQPGPRLTQWCVLAAFHLWAFVMSLLFPGGVGAHLQLRVHSPWLQAGDGPQGKWDPSWAAAFRK